MFLLTKKTLVLPDHRLRVQEPPSYLNITGLHAVQSLFTATIRAALYSCTRKTKKQNHHSSVISELVFFSLVPEEQRQRFLAGKRYQTKSLRTSDCIERAGLLSFKGLESICL